MIFISTTCFNFEFLESPDEAIENGLFNVELSGGGRYYNSEFLRNQISSFLSNPGTNIRIHNYFPIPEESFIMNFSSENDEITEKSLEHAEKALVLCDEFNIPYYSIHPGYLAQSGTANLKGHFDFKKNSFIDYNTALNIFLKNMNRLYELAEKYKVKLAVENLFPKFGKIDSLNNTFDDFYKILAGVPNDVGILIDLGHLNVSATALKFDRIGYLKSMIKNFGERIFEVHISGNDGSDDQHLPLTENDWQYEAVQLLMDLAGATVDGIALTLEVRKIDIDLIKELKKKLDRSIGEK